MSKRKDVLLKPAHSQAPIIQCGNYCSLICMAARYKVSSHSQCVSKDITASPQEKVPFTWHYFLHSLSQAGPQQLLCFLLQLLPKCLIFMNWKISLSRLFATSSLFFPPSLVTCYCTKFRLVLQNRFYKTRGTAEQTLILRFDGTLPKDQSCSE